MTFLGVYTGKCGDHGCVTSSLFSLLAWRCFELNQGSCLTNSIVFVKLMSPVHLIDADVFFLFFVVDVQTEWWVILEASKSIYPNYKGMRVHVEDAGSFCQTSLTSPFVPLP